MASRKIAKSLQYVLFLVAGIVLLYFAFRGVDLNELLSEIRHADYRWVAMSMLFAALALVFRTFRWRMLIETLDERPSAINIFHAVNVGYLANFALPRIGEITRCGILNRTDKVPAGSLFGTVIVERVFDLLMAALMLCLLLLLRFGELSGFMAAQIFHPLKDRMSETENAGWLVALAALASLTIFACYKYFKARLSTFSLARKVKDLLLGVAKGIRSAYLIRNFKLFIALNFLIFGMYFMQTYVLFFALPSTSSLGLVDGLFLLVLSALAIIIPVQGGIGAFHWIISLGLTLFGLTREEGMVYATLSHTATSALFIFLGTASLAAVFLGGGKKTKNPTCITREGVGEDCSSKSKV